MERRGPLERYFEIVRGKQDAAYLMTKQTIMEDGKTLFDHKLAAAKVMIESCHLCERRCNADRRSREVGYCGVDAVSRIASEFLHRGEEEELVPSHTIFFTGCTFSCVYCQNWDIATSPQSGAPALPEIVCEAIVRRNIEGARNVNFVGGDPTPHISTILRILDHCSVNTPIIFNSNMYLSDEGMELLDGVIDLYLGDFRYGNDVCAKKYSNVDRYWEVVTRNFLYATADADLLIRHLVLPGHLECCTRPIMEWTAANMERVRFNLMFQYRPSYRADLYPEINRCLTHDEMADAMEMYNKLLAKP